METNIDYEFAKQVMESVHEDYNSFMSEVQRDILKELSDIRCDKVDFLRGRLSLINDIRIQFSVFVAVDHGWFCC